jgi:hypothetical protein
MVAPAGGIPISFSYGGTAARGAGCDYTADGTITIPAGSNSASISISALADYALEGPETIAVTAPTSVTVAGIGYEIVGSLPSITIGDKTDGAIEVVKQTPVGAASEPATHGSFRIKYKNSSVTRTVATKVLYTITGAPAGTSYTVSPTPVGEATIPAGQNYVDVRINVINNYKVEGERNIELTISNATPL